MRNSDDRTREELEAVFDKLSKNNLLFNQKG